MSITRVRHLNEEAVLRAVVDAGDLTEREKEHLSTCGVCRERMEDLTRSLVALGEKVDENLPPIPPLPGFAPGAAKTTEGFRGLFTGNRLWAGAMVTAVLLVGLFWVTTLNREAPEKLSWWRQTEGNMLFNTPESDQEEVLPSKLAQFLESESFILDKDFMEFVAPFETANGDQMENGGIS